MCHPRCVYDLRNKLVNTQAKHNKVLSYLLCTCISKTCIGIYDSYSINKYFIPCRFDLYITQFISGNVKAVCTHKTH